MPVLLFLLLAPWTLSAIQGRFTEHEIRAAYLFNFASFIHWSSQGANSDAFDFCVVDASTAVAKALAQLIDQETVLGQRLTVLAVGTGQAPASCRILYLPGAGAEFGLPDPPRAGLLTVGDRMEFLDRGGMVALTLQNNPGLRASSKLLRLARLVSEQGADRE